MAGMNCHGRPTRWPHVIHAVTTLLQCVHRGRHTPDGGQLWQTMMRQRIMIIMSVMAFVLVSIVHPAHADTYTDFNVSGVFTDPYHDNLSLTGSIMVDNATDAIADASLKLVGEAWTDIVSQGLSGSYYDVSIQTPVFNTGCSSANNCFDTLTLALSEPISALIADGEASIVSGYADLSDAGFAISLEAGTGSLIDPPSPTPLPTSLPLFATGLGVMGLLGWRGRRRNNAVAA
jgi:hypothetical protein